MDSFRFHFCLEEKKKKEISFKEKIEQKMYKNVDTQIPEKKKKKRLKTIKESWKCDGDI